MKIIITRISSIVELDNRNLGVTAMDSTGVLHTMEISPEAQEVMRLPFPQQESVLPMFRIHLRSGVTLDLPAGKPELQEVAAALNAFLKRS